VPTRRALLELLDSLTRAWLEDLAEDLPSAVSRRAGFERPAEQLAGALARSLAERPVLCDLISAQAAVLEHNESTTTIASFKRRGVANAAALVELVRQALPELSDDRAWRLVVGALLLTSSLWAHATPTQAVRDAYELLPEPDSMRLDFSATLADSLVSMAMGLHARSRRR
jgi:hypothetical protein